MIPLCVPDLSGNEARYLAECVETTFVSSVGPFVNRFETMIAYATGAGQAVATSAGTTALHLALVTLGVEPGDLVIVPSFTFIASANAIAHAGAVPWLADIAVDSWTLDPLVLERMLDEETVVRRGQRLHCRSGRRVAAVMPVHTLGSPADLDAIVPIARAAGLPVVADGAACLGATLRGRPAGRMGADLTCLSFNGNKTVTTGGGGALVGDDAALCALARHLGTTARVGRDYNHDRIGFNYRMTNLAAAVGCAQLERLDAFLTAKRRIRAGYEVGLANRADYGRFPAPDWAEGACWLSGLVARDPAHAARLRATLAEGGVEARSFWKPVHLQAPYADAPRTPQPVADDLWERVVILPSSVALTEAEQGQVIDLLRAQR
ncbi:DegT/DnrJ/EryC1/StrS family aminotransferase [Phaeospirillum tilakii]|uniref:DegT/DnrJ/EryC1/StrS family aminotransferase n=1 Tax=Phaeospirillum tilakii TaxID=741673 RepID=A0ABW5CGU6_9PROT